MKGLVILGIALYAPPMKTVSPKKPSICLRDFRRPFLCLFFCVLYFACGGGTDGGGGDGSQPVPGVSAEGWESAYLDGSTSLRCSMSPADMENSGAAKVSISGSTIYVGFEQVGNNQNPVFARADNGELVYCRVHEDEGPDGRLEGLTWNGGEVAYAVYTVLGGGTSLEGLGGWLPSYAPGALNGGDKKVSFLGRIQVESGELDRGTFIMAVLSEGDRINSHEPADAPKVLENGNIEFLGDSRFKPIAADGRSQMECGESDPFLTRYHFSADLETLVCAESSNCSPVMPCN